MILKSSGELSSHPLPIFSLKKKKIVNNIEIKK